MAKVSVDRTKCEFDKGCRTCLEICCTGVFMVHSLKPRTHEHKPTGFRVSPILDTLCIECDECVRCCKSGAISVSH